jgi:hypothetical protein
MIAMIGRTLPVASAYRLEYQDDHDPPEYDLNLFDGSDTPYNQV